MAKQVWLVDSLLLNSEQLKKTNLNNDLSF